MAYPKHTQQSESIQEIPAEKVCSKCKVPKPIREFCKHKGKKDGRSFWCQACSAISTQKWRKANPEKVAAQKRRYYEKHADEVMSAVHRRYKNNRTEIIAKTKIYQRENPEKIKAKSAVLRAKRTGELIKPHICSRCGKECNPDAHHRSYLPEHQLEVIWLCRLCHRQLHAKEKMPEQKEMFAE